MRALRIVFQMAASLLLVVAACQAQKADRKSEMSDAEYIKQAVSAAPQAVGEGAAVVRIEKDGTMSTLRAGNNGFTCMVMGGEKMCNDANAMEFFHAVMSHTPPPDKLGFSYMLSGDDAGGSNTDPSATAKTADNHWIVTGPHIMILGPASKTLGLTRDKDPDPKKPYMMWAGTPYEHAMIPVSVKK
jgi:hypothetical protein